MALAGIGWETVITAQDGKTSWITKDVEAKLSEIFVQKSLQVGHLITLDEAFSIPDLPEPRDYMQRWSNWEKFFEDVVPKWKKAYYEKEGIDVNGLKMTNEEMLLKLREMARKDGKVPGYKELRLNPDPMVPGANTLTARFGGPGLKKVLFLAGITTAEGAPNEAFFQGEDEWEMPEEALEKKSEKAEAPEKTEKVAKNSEKPKKGKVGITDLYTEFSEVKIVVLKKDGTEVSLPKYDAGRKILVTEAVARAARAVGRETNDLIVAMKMNEEKGSDSAPQPGYVPAYPEGSK